MYHFGVYNYRSSNISVDTSVPVVRREEIPMRILRIAVSGVVAYIVVAVIFIVSSIVQSPNKMNGPGVLLFPLGNYTFIIVAALASVLVMWFVGRRRIPSRPS
jgi:hypothetical protein